MALFAGIQGAALLANTFRDPTILTRQGHHSSAGSTRSRVRSATDFTPSSNERRHAPELA
jgi:hypothetical protein